MTIRARSHLLRMALALMLAIGTALSALGMASSHTAVPGFGLERLGQAPTISSADVSQAHEHAPEQGKHAHGHNSSDHSHEVPDTPTRPTAWVGRATEEWWITAAASVDMRDLFGLDRPPKARS